MANCIMFERVFIFKKENHSRPYTHTNIYIIENMNNFIILSFFIVTTLIVTLMIPWIVLLL